MARICEDPYNRLFSVAVRDADPRERMAELGDLGFMEFAVEMSRQPSMFTLRQAFRSGEMKVSAMGDFAVTSRKLRGHSCRLASFAAR